jgi:hypothetical protein
MRRSLYIFSFDLRWYSVLLLATALAVVGLGAGAVLIVKRLNGEVLPNQQLLDYQLHKIGNGPLPEMVFIGDSSLGNAISSSTWTQLSGLHAVNLALTGSYGYEGSYNMLRRILIWGTPQHVVIMQAADMMQRGPARDAYLMTAPGMLATVIAYWRLTMNSQQIGAALAWLWEHGPVMLQTGVHLPPAQPMIVNDYVRQRAARANVPAAPWRSSTIVRESAASLARIAGLCAERELDCLYVHGPLAEPLCSHSTEYFAAVARLVTAMKMRLAAVEPICITAEDVGDSVDHVRAERKELYTRKYFELLAPQLRRRP